MKIFAEIGQRVAQRTGIPRGFVVVFLWLAFLCVMAAGVFVLPLCFLFAPHRTTAFLRKRSAISLADQQRANALRNPH